MYSLTAQRQVPSHYLLYKCNHCRWQVEHVKEELLHKSGTKQLNLMSKVKVYTETNLKISLITSSVHEQRRCFTELFEEESKQALFSDERAVSAFVLKNTSLIQNKTLINKRAYGIPFYINDDVAIDAVQAYHGSSVEVCRIEHILMPFWLLTTGAGGSFRADILQRNYHSAVASYSSSWVSVPRYRFSYPFGEHMLFNQICAAYTEPLPMMEECLTGTHIPSMLLSRYELLEHAKQMSHPPRLVPFIMSTNTALKIVEKRITRKMVLDRIDNELVKFHGRFIRSNVWIESVGMEALQIRPIFLPLIKLTVRIPAYSLRSSSKQRGEQQEWEYELEPKCAEEHKEQQEQNNNANKNAQQVNTTWDNTIVSYVCGATGKVAGVTPHIPHRLRWRYIGMSGLSTLLCLAPFVEPTLACTAALTAGICTPALLQQYKQLECCKRQVAQWAELRRTGLLNFTADSGGYRWTVEDEEKAEYEYREELRHAARRKLAFEEQLREEDRRNKARAERKERLFNFAQGTRHDLLHTDPLGYYEILGLKGKEYSANMKEIADAFRSAVRKHHPDVSLIDDEEQNRQHMQKVITAYRVLSNTSTRKEYDNSIVNTTQQHNYTKDEMKQQSNEESNNNEFYNDYNKSNTKNNKYMHEREQRFEEEPANALS